MEDLKLMITQLIDAKLEELPEISKGVKHVLFEKSVAIIEIRAVVSEIDYRTENLSILERKDLKEFYLTEIKRYLKSFRQ